MQSQVPQIWPTPPNYNIFEIMPFELYQALPRIEPEHSDPFLMQNVFRNLNSIAWHSRYRTRFPHSLEYIALRSITSENIEQLTRVLQHPRFNIDAPIDKKYGLTALQYCAMKNKFAIMELLLMHGANINRPDDEGNTPLMMAVKNQSLECINTLLKNGCDRHIANAYGRTPAEMAVQEESANIAEFINQHPPVRRRFPKFRLSLDIEKRLKTPMQNFLSKYMVLVGKPIRNPFNNFKGLYRINLSEAKTLEELIGLKTKPDAKP